MSIENSMERGFDTMAGHLTDIKDMVIDQNEWYEEMFYDGDSCSDLSDKYDTNDDLPTVSDPDDHKKGSGFPAGAKKKRSAQRKANLKEFDHTRELILSAKAINGRGPCKIKSLLANQSYPRSEPRSSITLPGSGFG
jgi:hypothetical protein